MKLYLHWLRWDLRRFRWQLLVWTALLTAFVCYLGWLHLNLLTIDPGILKYNEVGGAILGIVEFFLLLRILSSDPAAGTCPFWKTRPPAGMSVAAAKASIAILFFLALPMLLQWLMYRWCALGEPGPHWGGKSWPWMLWWTQCLGIGALLLASAAASGPGMVLGTLAGGALLAGGGFLALSNWGRDLSPEVSTVILTGAAESAAFHAGNISLWLAAGLILFLRLRRTRSPGGWIASVPFLLPPLALLAAAAFTPQHPRDNPPVLPALVPAEVEGLKIGEPLFQSGLNINHWIIGETPFIAIQLRLHLDGLPPEHLAHAAWQELRLHFDDGRVLPVQAERLLPWPYREPDRDRLPVSAFVLPGRELAPYSLQPCRSEGTLRITFDKLHELTIPKEPGAMLEGREFRLLVRHISALDGITEGGSLAAMSATTGTDTGFPGAGYFLEDPLEPECRLFLARNAERDWARGYFMERRRSDWMLQQMTYQPVARGRAQNAAKDGKLSAWPLRTQWYDPAWTTKLCISLNHLYIPRLSGDMRAAEDVVAGLEVTPEMSSAEAERVVRFALKLPALTASMPENGVSIPPPPPNHPFLRALTTFLDRVPATHLPVLFGIAERDQPAAGSAEPRWEPVFQSYLASRLDAAGAKALEQSHPRAFEYLADALAARGLISPERARQTATQRLSDAALLNTWKSQLGKYATTPYIRPEPLVEALRRGLPWAATELADLATVAPNDLSPSDLLPAVSQLSDCPSNRKDAIPWLQLNAARLTWDAAAKRWVLPSP